MTSQGSGIQTGWSRQLHEGRKRQYYIPLQIGYELLAAVQKIVRMTYSTIFDDPSSFKEFATNWMPLSPGPPGFMKTDLPQDFSLAAGMRTTGIRSVPLEGSL